ncbi:unnamed protein product [Rodentolepis nana]|uniref:PBPe domain-containing protein n=1 Tax=Rodentolepis nana TaxID=102285 RepID=A0A0R3TQV1_RODNA|nr:unnamed protein product [Rodentolepis nana]
MLDLTFNVNIKPDVVKKVFESIYPQRPIENLTFETLSPEGSASNAVGIFGAKDYFISRKKLDPFICNSSNKMEDIYVSTLDLDPAKILRACVELMEEMRGPRSLPSEKTIIAMPKYRSEFHPSHHSELLKKELLMAFLVLDFILIASNITTQMSMFWYQNVDDAEVLTTKINEVNAENVILLLPSENVNNVIENAYNKSLFTWNRRWVIAPMDGGIPQPPKGHEVDMANVSVLYVGNSEVPLGDIANTMEDKLASDTAHAAKAYIESACNDSLTETHYTGLTGDFDFNNINEPRTSIALTVARGLMKTPKNVGSVVIKDNTAKINGTFNELFSFTNEAIETILKSRKMRIAVVLATPFAMFKDSSKKISEPNSCNIFDLTGMTIDVVRAILDPIGVEYECTCYPVSMSSDSLMSVNQGFADMAVGDFAVLPDLKDEFDFISNFLYFTLAILEKPEITQKKTYLWLFLQPLSAGSWVLILFCSIVVALVLATLNYFSPNNVNYGFYESIFVTFGCLFQGLTVSPPNQWSSRFMLCVWWLFVLFFTVIYIANYAALIMYNGIQSEATGFTGLLVDPSIPFGALPNSVAAAQIKLSNDLEIQKINYLSDKLYSQANERNITIEERVQQVRDGKYRLISDSFTLDYFANKYCLVVTGEYSSQQYAIFLKLNTVYTKYLNGRLTALINDGTIKKITNSYTDQQSSRTCTMPVEKGANGGGHRYTITLSEVGGIFILMLIGIVIAIILSIVECIFARKLMVITTSILQHC